VNNGRLTDAGLQHLAGLRQVESFGYIGTAMQGHAFARFEGWTKLRQCSFRGSAIDDEGLALICDDFRTWRASAWRTRSTRMLGRFTWRS
jgi:hypothetical protein